MSVRGPAPRNLADQLGHAAVFGAWQLDQLRRWREPAPEWVLAFVDDQMAPLPPPGPLWQRLVPQAPTIRDLVTLLRDVARDPRPVGIVLHVRPLSMPASSIETLRSAIAEVRAAGKRVMAFAPHYTLGGYFLACACDEIIVQKGGHVGPLSLRRGYFHIADGLDRAGLRFDAVQIAPHKTAADTFTRREMSAAAREMGEWLLEGAWQEMKASIADGRGLTAEAVDALLADGFFTDIEARAAGIVDHVGGEEDLPTHLAHRHWTRSGLPPERGTRGFSSGGVPAAAGPRRFRPARTSRAGTPGPTPASSRALASASSNVPSASTRPRSKACRPVQTRPPATASSASSGRLRLVATRARKTSYTRRMWPSIVSRSASLNAVALSNRPAAPPRERVSWLKVSFSQSPPSTSLPLRTPIEPVIVPGWATIQRAGVAT